MTIFNTNIIHEGERLSLTVEVTGQAPSKLHASQCESDQDYYGWVEYCYVAYNEDGELQDDVVISDKVLKREFEFYLEMHTEY